MSSSTKGRRNGGGKGKVLSDSSAPLASASASFVGSNVVILTLILIRLPAKFLLVLKSVSKQWLSIITDPKFVHKHFIQNPSLSVPGLFWGYDFLPNMKKPTYDYIFLDGNTNSHVPFEKKIAFKVGRSLRAGIKIVQSCNGLLLCSDCAPRDADQTYYIFNPFTKQHKILPPSSQMRSSAGGGFPHLENVSLAFDPFKSPYYKVISFWGSSDYKYRIEIYDSETSSWTLSGFDSCTPRAKFILSTHVIFWNGSLYWCDVLTGSVAYFDIDEEVVGVVPLPSLAQANGDTKTFDIAEYGGHFYLIVRDWTHEPLLSLSIFEMNSADSSWKLKGQIDARLNPYAGAPCESTRLPYLDYVIFITEKEKENESSKVVLLTKESKVLSYDLESMSYAKIYDLSARQKFDASVKFYQYIESLACV